MKATLRIVGVAILTVDIPPGMEGMVDRIEEDLPREMGDVLSELGIDDVGEHEFMDALQSLEIESVLAVGDRVDGPPIVEGSR
jgi:hypothetical protein